MNREIEFRGKRVSGGEWVHGSLIEYPENLSWKKGVEIWSFDTEHGEYDEVDPETVGQYTGLKDKNGVKIFEGDMPGGTWESLVIGWCDKCASFQLFTPDGKCLACLGDVTWSDFVGDVHEGVVEVVGSIHDNPELLEV